MSTNPIPLLPQPGIKRDGTTLEGDTYVDGRWVRFQRGRPRKMGGYRSINKFIEEIPRAIEQYTADSETVVHLGSANLVSRFIIDSGFNTSVISDRTPTSGFTADSDNMWQFAIGFDSSAGAQIFGQVAPNLDCLCSSDAGAVFYGSLTGTTALTAVTAPAAGFHSLSGGVVSLAPYMVVFGSDGYVAWSVPNTPSDFNGSGSGEAHVTSQKIVAGRPLRGGPSNTPAGLLWSADTLIRMSYVGGTPVFSFDTISAEISILSSRSPVEYDGVFYWPGTDRFLSYNGVVREVPNDKNINFFFDNLNSSQRQKVFGFKVPRFGEIWWCFPKGDATEPNHAIVYNVREGTWYDTALPNAGRSAAASPTVFPKPILSGVDPLNYRLDSVAIDTAGTGYSAGDLLSISSGDEIQPLEVTVDTVGGSGEITAVSITRAGEYTTVPSNPVSMSGGGGSGAALDLTFVQPYRVWVHEVGVDEVRDNTQLPVRSYFKTSDLSMRKLSNSASDKAVYLDLIEPDFVQAGDMTVAVYGRQNARAQEDELGSRTFTDSATAAGEELVSLRADRRFLSFQFESNTLGGNYEMGEIYVHLSEGSGRQRR